MEQHEDGDDIDAMALYGRMTTDQLVRARGAFEGDKAAIEQRFERSMAFMNRRIALIERELERRGSGR